MKRFIQQAVTLVLFLAIAGCGLFSAPSMQGRDKHYLKANSIPPMRTLPGTKPNAFHSYYPIPDRQYPESAKTVSIVPPGLN